MGEAAEPGSGAQTFSDISEAADDSVNEVITSIVGLIKTGNLQRHVPTEGWGIHKKNLKKETVDLLAKQKRYNRVTKLLNKAEQGQLDDQTLNVLNNEIDQSTAVVAEAAPEDIILQDLSFLVKAKEERRRVKEARRQAALQQKKVAERARAREIEIAKLSQEDEDRRKAWEMEMVQKIAEDKEARRAKLKEKKEAQKKAEKEAMKKAQALRKKLKAQQTGGEPLYKKLEQKYQEEIKLPELENKKKYLASLREQLSKPVKDIIQEHQEKVPVKPHRKVKIIQKPIQVYRSKQYEEVSKKLPTPLEKKAAMLKQRQDYARQIKEANLKKAQLYKEKGGILNKLVVAPSPKALADQRRKAGLKKAEETKNYLASGVKELKEKPVKREFTKVEKSKPPGKPKRENYLEAMKKESAIRSTNTTPKPQKGTLHQLSKQTKELEEQVTKKEKNLKNDYSTTSLENAAEVSEMYVDVAKKKLAMLSGQPPDP
mmetsp:Transcript_13228/g.25715  ORF Transcript_13228/g.25715 Transcript_13228/m.25715 type:complete len:486 (-) Transcript_13228:206-1663(-)|eukprot:CAMPEP_0175160136 /NCGR_PEP_ID=MMETSP0087-20121206/23837_1 /TAXON_ID=136419 /ORGANISM="Unknown Unknown, Strain D1" /LENGTH=485 /DNA_ID=CAMNT_0016448317 /DNA_START=149 /DNA_END=1606 /DNA_ORIENTATION=-